MRYTDITAGQKVLYSWYRTSSPRFNLARCQEATVLETGVKYRYQVQTGGWSGHKKWRDTIQGVRIQLKDEELVTLAVFLLLPTPEWEVVQNKKAAREREIAAQMQKRNELKQQFADAGFVVVIGRDLSSVVFQGEDIPRLLGTLRDGAGALR
jgi:cytidylate kinase